MLPGADDKNPSLSVTDGDKGTIVLCHAGCPFVRNHHRAERNGHLAPPLELGARKSVAQGR